MKNKLKIILIAFIIGAISSCSEFERELLIKKEQVEGYPFTMCDKNESLLICDSAELKNCWGYIEEGSVTDLQEL